MNHLITAGLALCLVTGSVLGADDRTGSNGSNSERDSSASEMRPIDARVVRVKLDGVIDLKLRQGAVAQLVLTGERKYLLKTTTVQSGDTLTIDTDDRNIKIGRRHMLHAELTLPRLRELRSDSVGSTEVFGFSGDEIDLTLDGAGAMKVVADYRVVNASLGGIGSMNIQCGSSERIDLNLHGAGYVTLIGRTKFLKASLGRTGRAGSREIPGRHGRSRYERPGQRERAGAPERRAQFVGHGLGDGVRQAAKPHRQRGWPGQGQLEVARAGAARGDACIKNTNRTTSRTTTPPAYRGT